jgi:methylenetetrahydrofolate reductase (NADPH)
MDEALALREAPASDVRATISKLAQEASIEITVRELDDVEASRRFRSPGQKVFVSHLPGQTWEQTRDAAVILRRAGFEPVPHVPVRLIESREALEDLLRNLVDHAQIQDLLLIAGDYANACGPYASVSDVLGSGVLAKQGVRRISIGGHPEGHPKVPREEIRRAEREKARLAAELGLDVTFVTQFFFEPGPFLGWLAQLRASGVHARVVAGLAGPAKISTLVKYALRCGVGPSLKAMGTHAAALARLAGDHAPDQLIRALVEERTSDRQTFEGLHFFCFGGYLRTCEWLHGISTGRFELNGRGGFDT